MKNPKQEILKLQSGGKWIWSESDYGRAEIWRVNNIYLLFEIPMYGSEPMFCDSYKEIDELIKTVEGWT